MQKELFREVADSWDWGWFSASDATGGVFAAADMSNARVGRAGRERRKRFGAIFFSEKSS